MIKKLKKIDFKLLGIITIIVTILCNAFLQMHYSSDTFCINGSWVYELSSKILFIRW